MLLQAFSNTTCGGGQIGVWVVLDFEVIKLFDVVKNIQVSVCIPPTTETYLGDVKITMALQN